MMWSLRSPSTVKLSRQNTIIKIYYYYYYSLYYCCKQNLVTISRQHTVKHTTKQIRPGGQTNYSLKDKTAEEGFKRNRSRPSGQRRPELHLYEVLHQNANCLMFLFWQRNIWAIRLKMLGTHLFIKPLEVPPAPARKRWFGQLIGSASPFKRNSPSIKYS